MLGEFHKDFSAYIYLSFISNIFKQNLRNFDYSLCCEMVVPVKNAVTFGETQTNSLCYKDAQTNSLCYKDAQTNSLCYKDAQANSLCYKDAQANSLCYKRAACVSSKVFCLAWTLFCYKGLRHYETPNNFGARTCLFRAALHYF